MTLDVALINQIDTPVVGQNAASASVAGEPGNAAAATPLDVSGDSFFDPSAALALTPSVRGGMGGGGGGGTASVAPVPQTSDIGPGDSTLEVTYSDASMGGAGGQGGDGGGASFDAANDTIGSAATPYGGTITFAAATQGGDGATGGNGAGGDDAGVDQQSAAPPTVEIGAGGGSGGEGARAGSGGGAATTIGGLSVDTLPQDITITLSAVGGGGGGGGHGGRGGDGQSGGLGANGAAGGDGGDATAALSDSTLIDPAGVFISLGAVGGDGGIGGGGGVGGVGENLGTIGFGTPLNQFLDYQPGGNGGSGGSAGAALAELIGNSITAGGVAIALDAGDGGAPGAGGAGSGAVASSQSTDPAGDSSTVNGVAAGTDGTAGVAVPGRIVFTGNTVSAGTVLDISLAAFSDQQPIPLDGGGGGDLAFSGNDFIGGGTAALTLLGTGSGVLVDDLDGALSIGGSPGNGMTGFSHFTLDAGDTFIAGTGNPEVVFVSPDPDTIVLRPGHAALTLQDTTTADTILQFQGYGAALDSVVALQADTIAGGGSVTIDVPGDGAITLAASSWSPNAGDVSFAAACFAAGSRIATPTGELAIEALRAGDVLLTASGDRVPVIWTGHRRVDCRPHPRPHEVWPVRVRAAAFGVGRPHRDLLLSPDHAVFIDGVLIPIRYLINAATIIQECRDEVTYWHVELARHDVILAQGLACESYLDTGNRDAFEPAVTGRHWLPRATAAAVARAAMPGTR